MIKSILSGAAELASLGLLLTFIALIAHTPGAS